MTPLTRKSQNAKSFKCGPICIATQMTEMGGIPMLILPGLVRAVLSRSEAEGMRDQIDRMLSDDSVVWAEEVDWRAVL